MAKPKAQPTRIQRSGNGHQYFLDGQKVPGVTTILSKGVPKPGLMNWSAGILAEFVVERLVPLKAPSGQIRIVADDLVKDALEWNATRERPTQVSDSPVPRNGLVEILKNLRYKDLGEAGAKGTDVHNLAHRLALGEEVEVPTELAGHVKSYLQFLTEWEPRDALVERVIINRRWRYMGKFDLLATFDNVPDWIYERVGRRDHVVGLLDIKTARSGVFADNALQLVGYQNGETMLDGDTEVPMPEVDFVAVIHVRHDGYDVIAFDIETEHRPTTFDIFLYCQQIGDWLDWENGTAATIKSPSLRRGNVTTAGELNQ